VSLVSLIDDATLMIFWLVPLQPLSQINPT